MSQRNPGSGQRVGFNLHPSSFSSRSGHPVCFILRNFYKSSDLPALNPPSSLLSFFSLLCFSLPRSLRLCERHPGEKERVY